MDWSKYRLDKLMYLLAAIIPGFTALLVFDLRRPGSFNWFIQLGFLGYRTKLAIAILVAFMIGHTLTSLLGAMLGAMGGAFGGVVGYLPPYFHKAAPWRDSAWRQALKKVLGDKSPRDSQLITQETYDFESKMAEQLPPEQRVARQGTLTLEKFEREKDDKDWALWYDHYHKIVIQPDDQDIVFHVRHGLNFNLQATALYVLISTMFVRDLRHWWCFVPTCLWTVSLIGSEYWGWKQLTDKWATLNTQITYLSKLGSIGGMARQ